MKGSPAVEILDITEHSTYERYLYRCLAPMPFTKYENRRKYLESAIPRGFCKKILIFNEDVVGAIEYATAEGSGFPILGDGIVVMNCIWVLRKVKGHNFGRLLFVDMTESKNNATGFATIALENHWSPWMKKSQMERFGFKSVKSIEMAHKTKHEGECFKAHLMWLPTTEKSKPPTWNERELLEGVDFCMAHPLYHPQKLKLRKIFEIC